MSNSGDFQEYRDNIEEKPEETKKTGSFQKVWNVMRMIGNLIYRLRKVIMTIPVVYYAIVFGVYNAKYLPDRVGLVLQSNGEFAQTVSRGLAVMGPLGVTAACLLLMFCSRRTLYPWLISIMSLLLPMLILLLNNYPT
ncbi:MAG: hypothetical protein UHS47_08045 [Oscillospiraceae bacterium]|nr:hypothetical protein [Oscillospiraceae bacterium]